MAAEVNHAHTAKTRKLPASSFLLYRFSGCGAGRGFSGLGGRGISVLGGCGISDRGRCGVGVLGLSVIISFYTTQWARFKPYFVFA
jgi:hypothetical protein